MRAKTTMRSERMGLVAVVLSIEADGSGFRPPRPPRQVSHEPMPSVRPGGGSARSRHPRRRLQRDGRRG